MPVIGFLQSGSAGATTHMLAAFHSGLREAGYIEGQNVASVYRYADGQYDRLPMLAAELVGSQAAVLAATGGDSAVLAARAATRQFQLYLQSVAIRLRSATSLASTDQVAT